MGVVPNDRIQKIQFYEAHAPVWTANAVAIGLTAAQCTALTGLTTTARANFNAHVAAQAAAKSATQKFYDSVRAMHAGAGAGADMIQTIKTYAQTKNDPNVYTLAQIPPPATPGTTPPPGTPFDFSVTLMGDGSLGLRWKCNNPSGTVGTIYEVKRMVGRGGMQFVGASGVKSFTDETLPAGSTPVTYQITAIRSTSRGNPAQFVVNFGVGGGGGLTIASVSNATSEDAGMKMAA